MTEQIFDFPCYSVLKTSDGFWTSSNRCIRRLDANGNMIDRFAIHNPDGFCYHTASDQVGALDTSGQLYIINGNQKTVQPVDLLTKYESHFPVLDNNMMYWVQWDGVIFAFDFSKNELKHIGEIGSNVFARGYTYDPRTKKLYILFSSPPKQQTFLACVNPLTGKVEHQELPRSFPKELAGILLIENHFLCLRKRHPALFLISSENYNTKKEIRLRSKIWAAYGFCLNALQKAVFIWNNSIVIKVDLQSGDVNTVWEDEYISRVTVSQDGTLCIGTLKRGIILR